MEMRILGALSLLGALAMGCQEREQFQGLGVTPVFIKGSLETFPGHGYTDIGDLTLQIDAAGKWFALQSDYNNAAGCSWGEQSGVASGTWALEDGKRVMRLDGKYVEEQMRPLAAFEGAILEWTIRGWTIVDRNGREIHFWRVKEYERKRIRP